MVIYIRINRLVQNPSFNPLPSTQRHMREMLACAEQHQKKRLRVALISDIYTASTEDQAQKCIALIPQEKGKHWYVLLVISR